MSEHTQEQRIAAEVERRLAPLLEKVESLLGRAGQQYFTIDEAAEFVRCSGSHIRRHVLGGTLPASNIGTADGPDYRVSREDLVAWMEKRKGGAFPPPKRGKKSRPQVTSRYYGAVTPQ